MSASRTKLREIRDKLRFAKAQAHVLQRALTHGETDLELLASDLLVMHFDALTECYDEINNLIRPSPSTPRPPGKRRVKPTLRVVKGEQAA